MLIRQHHIGSESSGSTYSSGVDSNAVILVVTLCPRDSHARAASNVKAVGVVAEVISIAVRAVDSHVSDGQPVRAVDADGLNGRVLDVQVGDGAVRQIMGVEELGLRLAAVGALAVPPTGTVGVEVGPGGAFDGDLGALDLQQRAIPLFIAPSSLAFKDDLDTGYQQSQPPRGRGSGGLTCVSSSMSDRSRVVPEGTTREDRTMVEHDFWLLLARAAPDEPEKVQLVALLTRPASGADVMAGPGSATGEASTVAAKAAASWKKGLEETILEEVRQIRALCGAKEDRLEIVPCLDLLVYVFLGVPSSLIYFVWHRSVSRQVQLIVV